MEVSMTETTILTARQTVILAILGAALWFVAAMIVRVANAGDAFAGSGRAIIYALTVPGTVPFVFLSRAVGGLRRDQTGIGLAIVTGAAALLDGIALGWFPALYGQGQGAAANAGAVILWGAGVALALGLAFNRR